MGLLNKARRMIQQGMAQQRRQGHGGGHGSGGHRDEHGYRDERGYGGEHGYRDEHRRPGHH